MTNDPITSLSQLLDILEIGIKQEDYLNFLERLDLNLDQLSSFVKWDKSRYTRNLIYKNHNLRLLVMCWNPKNSTLIHGYENQEGWIKVLTGELELDYYQESTHDNKMEVSNHMSLKSNKAFYVNTYSGYHSVKNNSLKPAISIHLHLGTKEDWKVYDEHTNTFFETETKLDSSFY